MAYDENILKHEDRMTSSITAGGLVSVPKPGLNRIIIDNLEEVTRDGPDDPENPKDWATRRKWLAVISISGFFVLMSPLPTTIVAPALDIITRAQHHDYCSETNGFFNLFTRLRYWTHVH
jgi:CCR4-NOT transcription complex subunit 1